MLVLLFIIAYSHAQEFQNYFTLDHLTDVEVQISVTNKLHSKFIALASPLPISMTITQEGLEHANYFYDYEAFITQSDKHYIRLNGTYDLLYFYAGYLKPELYKNATFNVAIVPLKSDCISACANCQNAKCLCSDLKFGSYCQLERLNAILQIEYDMVIKPFAWKYVLFETQQLGDQPLKLRIKDLPADIYMGLGVDGLAKHEIPNMDQDAYLIPRNSQQQFFVLQTRLSEFQHHCPDCSILNLGFYNFNSFPIIFYFELQAQDKKDDSDQYRLYKLLISGGIFILFLICTLLVRQYKRKNRQREQQILIIQRNFRRRRHRRVERTNPETPKGFDQDFILTYFPTFYYLDLVENFPQLSEFVECVVCLQSMAPKEDKVIGESDHIDHCSVTPCFHVFHRHCLFKWLATQKNCPLCRQTFNESGIAAKAWISLEHDVSIRESCRANPYIKRMKTRGENTQGSELPLTQYEHERADTDRNDTNQTASLSQNKNARDLISAVSVRKAQQ